MDAAVTLAASDQPLRPPECQTAENTHDGNQQDEEEETSLAVPLRQLRVVAIKSIYQSVHKAKANTVMLEGFDDVGEIH